MKNLKAVSTLITTVLIIVVAVILVTILLSWGRNFTNTSVNKADELLNQKCDTATLNISECSILDDGNIIFRLKNTSKSYDFTDEDAFKVMIFDDSGTLDPEQDLTLSTGTWAGLEVGQTIIAKVAPETTTLTNDVSDTVNIMVRSTICSQTSVTSYGCQK